MKKIKNVSFRGKEAGKSPVSTFAPDSWKQGKTCNERGNFICFQFFQHMCGFTGNSDSPHQLGPWLCSCCTYLGSGNSDFTLWTSSSGLLWCFEPAFGSWVPPLYYKDFYVMDSHKLGQGAFAYVVKATARRKPSKQIQQY